MFVIFLAAGLIAALFKRAWLHVLACAGVLAIAAAFLAPLALAHTSNMSFGAPFFGTLIGGTLIFMRIFVANTSRWGALIAPIVMLVLALPSHCHSVPFAISRGCRLAIELEHYQSIYDDMVDRIARQATPAEPKVVFTFELFVAPYPNLSIRYFQRTGHFLSVPFRRLRRYDALLVGRCRFYGHDNAHWRNGHGAKCRRNSRRPLTLLWGMRASGRVADMS